MINSKTASMFLSISRIFLVVIIILVIPQLNFTEYVLPTITSKMIYFLNGVMILFGLFSLTVFLSKKIIFYFSQIDIALFMLLLYITLNRYFIQLNYGFSIRYIELLGLSLLYFILRQSSLKYYPWMLLSIVISGVIQTVHGYLQLLGIFSSNHSGFKMTGSFFNPGPYAGFLVITWIIALGMYLFKERTINQVSQKKNRSLFLGLLFKYTFEYIPFFGLISISVILPALQSRASWIAALVGGGILLELKYHFLKSLFRRVTTRFCKILVFSISFFLLISGIFSLYHYKKSSSDGRAFIWKVTTEIIKDRPVFGVGFDRFNANYMNYQAEYFANNGEPKESILADNTYYAFNEWLQFISENGILGLLFLLIVVYTLFKNKIKQSYQVEVIIARITLLMISAFACFSYPMQILPIKLILVFFLAFLSNSIADTYQITIGENKRNLWLFKIISSVVFCIAMKQTFTYTKSLNQGFVTWNNALNSYQYRDYKTAIKEYELAYPIFEKDGDFLMNYGKTLSLAGKPHKAILILEQAKHYKNNTIIATALGDSYKSTRQYNKAEVAYQQAINMTPSKFYANYLLIKLYDETKQEVKAVAMAKKLLNKEIKIPSTAIQEIQEEIKKILMKYKNPPGY